MIAGVRNRTTISLLAAMVIAAVALGFSPALQADEPHEVHRTEDVHVMVDCDGDECGDGRMVKVVMTAGDGEAHFISADDGDVIDISDMLVGETRYSTTEDGEEIAITREEDGYLVEVGDEEIRVNTSGDADHMKVIVGSGGEGFAFASGDVHSMAHGTWNTDDGRVIVMNGEDMSFGSAADTVTISGLGELDEAARQNIIDVLRAAGIDKEIRFIEKGTFHMITAGGPGQAFAIGSGEGSVDVDVDDDGSTNHKVIIRRIKTSGDEDDE